MSWPNLSRAHAMSGSVALLSSTGDAALAPMVSRVTAAALAPPAWEEEEEEEEAAAAGPNSSDDGDIDVNVDGNWAAGTCAAAPGVRVCSACAPAWTALAVAWPCCPAAPCHAGV